MKTKPRMSDPMYSQPLDLAIPHPCVHCGRTNTITVRVGGVAVVFEPEQPAIRIVGEMPQAQG